MKKMIGMFTVILISVILVISNPSTKSLHVYGNKDGTSATEISHEEIVELTSKFMDILVQEVDNNYKTIHVHSKEELLLKFEEVATRDVATQYVDFYYHETEDGMYILPTETPPWFIKENSFDLEELTSQKVKITQTNYTEIHGIYTIELKLTYDEKWKITEINLK